MTIEPINFRVAAREFCREKGYNNVDLIEAAIIRGAELAYQSATDLVTRANKEAKENHSPNRRY